MNNSLRENKLRRIIRLVLQLSATGMHPDKVARLHSILMDVNMEIGKEMLKIRKGRA